MKTFNVKTDDGTYDVSLPTKLDEITSEYLSYVTKDVNVAPEYSLVGLVYIDKLTMVLNSKKAKDGVTTRVVPIFVKAGTTDSKFVSSCLCGRKLLIPGSDLSMGLHVYCPDNKITINSVVSLLSKDKNVVSDAWKDNNLYYFLEFKLVPNCAIKGIISDTGNLDGNWINPFVRQEITNKAD